MFFCFVAGSGYGTIAPKTDWGRIVCITYAIVGIPLMLLCLAQLGDAFAKLFRFLYTQVCCCGCWRTAPVEGPSRTQSVRGGNGGTLTRQASVHEAWKSQYEAERTSSGGGAPVDHVIQISSAERPDEDVENMMVAAEARDENENEEEEEEEDFSEISVPLTIILGVIAGYIFLGTVLFGIWEGWDPLTAAYFCFITISTIGFGDVMPAAVAFQTTFDNYEMLGTALYMLFGMATLSMCFTLVQDQMAAKFKLLTEKFGVLTKRKKQGDEAGGDARHSGGGNQSDSKVDVLQSKRRQRAARLKFKWIRQKLSSSKRRKRQSTAGSETPRSPRSRAAGSETPRSRAARASRDSNAGDDDDVRMTNIVAAAAGRKANGAVHALSGVDNSGFELTTSNPGFMSTELTRRTISSSGLARPPGRARRKDGGGKDIVRSGVTVDEERL